MGETEESAKADEFRWTATHYYREILLRE